MLELLRTFRVLVVALVFSLFLLLYYSYATATSHWLFQDHFRVPIAVVSILNIFTNSSQTDWSTNEKFETNQTMNKATMPPPLTATSDGNNSLCQLPDRPLGPVHVELSSLGWDELNNAHLEVLAGGVWKPQNCTVRHKVAISIAFRDRDVHLRTFLHHMHPFLQRQGLDYGIYVIEQNAGSTFNRALLHNIGFMEAMKQDNYSCVVFHDVDLLPEDERNYYGCHQQPRHMCPAVDTLGYKLIYSSLFGGVESFTKEQFEKINGMSNMFFGWGGEDDDLYNRIAHHGYRLSRPDMAIGRYTMQKHTRDTPNRDRMRYLHSGHKRFATDGLNSLKYSRTRLEKRPLYTLIQVNIDQGSILS